MVTNLKNLLTTFTASNLKVIIATQDLTTTAGFIINIYFSHLVLGTKLPSHHLLSLLIFINFCTVRMWGKQEHRGISGSTPAFIEQSSGARGQFLLTVITVELLLFFMLSKRTTTVFFFLQRTNLVMPSWPSSKCPFCPAWTVAQSGVPAAWRRYGNRAHCFSG